MVLACPQEKAAWGFEDQFMLGDSLLVAPCLQPEGDVEIYLPASLGERWRRFPDGELFAAGRSHQLKLALNEIAAFVPEDVTIPLGPNMQFIDNN
jgi:alpha-D-xyloside xylohydrolase